MEGQIHLFFRFSMAGSREVRRMHLSGVSFTCKYKEAKKHVYGDGDTAIRIRGHGIWNFPKQPFGDTASIYKIKKNAI